MPPKLVITEDPKPFDIRNVPLWAVPQLAELKRRLTYTHDGVTTGATIISFEKTSTLPFINTSAGMFVIHIPGEGFYYGYLFSQHMNNYRHPSLFNNWE